jgi:hypothetical protein
MNRHNKSDDIVRCHVVVGHVDAKSIETLKIGEQSSIPNVVVATIAVAEWVARGGLPTS